MNRKRWWRTAEPEIGAVYLKQAKDFLRLMDSSEDMDVLSFIMAATTMCEEYTERSIITQNWVQTLDYYPWKEECIPLGRGPVQEIISITSYDVNNNPIVFDEENYYLDNNSLYDSVVLKNNRVWPSFILRDKGGVKIEYTTGYGDNPEDVPHDLRMSILSCVSWLYEFRETATDIPSQVSVIWNRYRAMEV